MTGQVGSNEIRVVMRPIKPPGFAPDLIPALLFKRVFDAFLAALVAADREIHVKTVASEFILSHLSMGTFEFGIIEKQRALGPGSISAIELFKRCASQVYHSDYQILLRYQRLMRAFHRIAKAIDPSYALLAQYSDGEFPFDGFFCRQLDRVGDRSEALHRPDGWFAGDSIASFVGRLTQIDYQGPVWTGRLMLPADGPSIECVFDRAKGEDALNPFGNKFVSLTGRAIYTGDSQTPERIEVITLEEAATGSRSAIPDSAPLAPEGEENPFRLDNAESPIADGRTSPTHPR